MPATATETAILDAPVEVRFTAAGTPLAVRYDRKVWAVAADAVHWFNRDARWNSRHTATVGSDDLVSIEYWRVQVRLGTSKSALRTFTLRRDPLTTQWLLETINDDS